MKFYEQVFENDSEQMTSKQKKRIEEVKEKGGDLTKENYKISKEIKKNKEKWTYNKKLEKMKEHRLSEIERKKTEKVDRDAQREKNRINRLKKCKILNGRRNDKGQPRMANLLKHYISKIGNYMD